MIRIAAALTWLNGLVQLERVHIALCLRVTVAAVSALLLSRALHLPIYLWAVLTAVILTQVTFGRSIKATIDYTIGTLAGVVFAGLVGVLISPANELSLAVALAIAVAPLALIAAIRPAFAVAPFTAVLVILAPTITHLSPISSAIYRVLEVLLGGTIAIVVSLLLFPERAEDLKMEAVARMLDVLSRSFRELIEGFTRNLDATAIDCIQNRVAKSFAYLEAVGADASQERMTYLALRRSREIGPLLRTLLRLRHDLVMMGRAAIVPLPEPFQMRLRPRLQFLADAISQYLSESGDALLKRRAPTSLDSVEQAMDAFAAEIDAFRKEGIMLGLSGDAVERIFALAFALEQSRHNFRDLQRCVVEFAILPR